MANELTKAGLYAVAQALEIEGRSNMDKAELIAAIASAGAVPAVEGAVGEFEEALEGLDESNDPAPEPKRPEVAPAISQEPTTQGGLTFLTDRAQ